MLEDCGGKCDLCRAEQYLKLVDEATSMDQLKTIAYAWILAAPPGDIIHGIFGKLMGIHPAERDRAIALARLGKGPLMPPAQGVADKDGAVPDRTQRVVVPDAFYKDN